MWNKPRGCASFHLWCPMSAEGKWIVSHMLTLEQSWTIPRQLKPLSLICCKAFRVRGHRLGPTCLSLPPAGALIRTRPLLKNVKNLGAALADVAPPQSAPASLSTQQTWTLTPLIPALTPATARQKGAGEALCQIDSSLNFMLIPLLPLPPPRPPLPQHQMLPTFDIKDIK